MSSRSELVQMMRELKIEYSDMSIDEMTEAVREESDKRFNRKWQIGNSELSETLLRFLSTEYDYVFKNQEGQQVNYKGELI